MTNNKAESVEKFVKSLFTKYDLDENDFFCEYDYETEDFFPKPLFLNGVIDDNMLKRLSVCLGMSKDEILNTDEQAGNRYAEKYPFFRLYQDFISSQEWYSKYKTTMPTAEDLLINAIFTENEGYPVEKRYDVHSVKKRLINKLKEIDKEIPGTYHQNADITNFAFRTEILFSFPKCYEMVSSFINAVNSYKELFYKVLESDLSESEINELNFLAHALEIRDVALFKITLDYANLLNLKETLIKENYSDFYSYARIDKTKNFFPWRCYEFFENKELVQELINIYPYNAKHKMREFSILVKNFSVRFIWSDADPMVLYEDLEKHPYETIETYLNLVIESESIVPEQRGLEITRIYIEKTSDETTNFDKCFSKLNEMLSPPSKGGLILPKRELDTRSQENRNRLFSHYDAVFGGNKQ